MDKSPLYLANRLVTGAMGVALTAADMANQQYISHFGSALNFGPLTSHVGSLPGFVAGMIGFMAPDLLSETLSSDKIKLIKYVLPAVLWGVVVTAEMTGFLNTADIYDLPAEIAAFVGAASIIEWIANQPSISSVWKSHKELPVSIAQPVELSSDLPNSII